MGQQPPVVPERAPVPPAAPAAATALPTETDADRRRRHARRTRLYVWSLLLVALLIILIALVVANTGPVMLSWVFGSGSASLVWVIVGTAVVGWLLGLVTSIMFRARTRQHPHP